MRYAVLLPPEPKRKKNENKGRRSEGPRAGTPTGDNGDVDTETEDIERPAQEVARPVSTGPKVQQVNNKTNARLALHPNSLSRTLAVSVALAATEPNVMMPAYNASDTPSSQDSPKAQRTRDSSTRLLLRAKSEGGQTPRGDQSTPPATSPPTDTVSAPPPRKRQRMDSQPKRNQTPELSTGTASVLLQIAARKAAQPTARQTSRTTLAFGYRVPPGVDSLDEYMLPEWLITQRELEHIHESRPRSTTRSASPNPRIPNGVVKHTAPVVQQKGDAAHEPNDALTGAMDVDELHRPALRTSSIRE